MKFSSSHLALTETFWSFHPQLRHRRRQIQHQIHRLHHGSALLALPRPRQRPPRPRQRPRLLRQGTLRAERRRHERHDQPGPRGQDGHVPARHGRGQSRRVGVAAAD